MATLEAPEPSCPSLSLEKTDSSFTLDVPHDTEMVNGDQADGVAKEHHSPSHPTREASGRPSLSLERKVTGYFDGSGALGMGALADAAKISDMEEQLKKKPCYIINPASPGMNVWDIVTALALIFTALVTPFEVGFLPSAESPLEALFLINRLLDGSVTQMAESVPPSPRWQQHPCQQARQARPWSLDGAMHAECRPPQGALEMRDHPLSPTGIFVVDMVISSLLMYRVPQSRKVEKSLDATKLKGQATADELSGRAGGTGHHSGKKPTAALTWEFRYRHVLYNYLTGWFFIDMLAVGPSAFDVYDLATTPSAVVNATASQLELGLGDVLGSPNGTALLDEAGGGGNLKVVKVLRVIRTLRLFKLLRLMRGSKIIKRWATRVSMPYATIAIAKLLLMVLYVTHFSACMLGVMATFSEPNAKLDSWQGYYGYCGEGSSPTGGRGKGGDVLSYDLVDNSGTFTCVGPFEMWLASLGWAIAIIVSGGGDPQTGPYPGNMSADPMSYLRGETVFLIFFLLAMAALWAYVTAKWWTLSPAPTPTPRFFATRLAT